jgi:hypothetical protein
MNHPSLKRWAIDWPSGKGDLFNHGRREPSVSLWLIRSGTVFVRRMIPPPRMLFLAALWNCHTTLWTVERLQARSMTAPIFH